jgi:phosphate transport system substrate-binding protein
MNPRAHQSTSVVRRVLSIAGVLLLAMGVGSALTSSPASAVTHAQINGSGSTWSSNALIAWIGQFKSQGLRVTFNGNGSAQGRQNFADGTVDFALSDIGYQGVDEQTGNADVSNRAYAFVPLVAGGTSFPYNLTVKGQRVTTLRLSGLTIAKIFTNQITNWDDAAITADNNGQAFPSTPIIPVVHSEGSGTTYQFTAYLAKVYPNVWRSFFPSGKPTEYWPAGKGAQISQSGSDGVMNYVASSAGQGTISIDEYSYAKAKNFPVVKVENSAGYYELPSQYNVAVALTQAQINQDKSDPTKYLLQDLSNVYGYNDPRTYPLSSYSYGIIPTSSTDPTMTTGKRQTLADFLYNSICTGQGSIDGVGYSALPINLVQAGFQQIDLLQTADPKVDLTQRDVSTCGNPTFVAGNPNENHLADIAPPPLACDKSGAGPCGTTGGSNPSPGAGSTTGTSGNTTGGGTTGGGKTTTGGKTTAGGQTRGGQTTGGQDTGDAGAQGAGGQGTGGQTGSGDTTQQDDLGLGSTTGGDRSGDGGSGNGGTALAGDNTSGSLQQTVIGPGQGTSAALAVLASVLLLVALILPPWLSRRWRPHGVRRP